MTPDELAAEFPRLYHMAEAGSWPSIARHGLLSTTALLDLFEVRGADREALESRHRPASVALTHLAHGTAVVRDQRPMDDRGLERSLRDGLTPRAWYERLNGRTFFWLSEERLARLLGARAYRGKRQTILVVPTADLLARHADRVRLSPINSGATKPAPAPRGEDTFLPIADYPYAAWRRKRRPTDAIVELTVAYAVPDIADIVARVSEVGGGAPDTVLWERPASVDAARTPGATAGR